jgi:hypothetical protein
MNIFKRTFKSGQIVRCTRAPLYEILENEFKSNGLFVSVYSAKIIREITSPEDAAAEMMGGIFEVEVEALPTFEVPIQSKTRAEIAEILSQFNSAGELLEAFKNNPELLGEMEFRTIPTTRKELFGKKIHVSGDSLIELVLN